jgi:hypothetical protein
MSVLRAPPPTHPRLAGFGQVGWHTRSGGLPVARGDRLSGTAPLGGSGRNGESRLRHPLRALSREAWHLRLVVARGESPATLAILIGTWIAIVVPLVALVCGLAFGVSYLVTGSPGSSYPSIP